MAKRLRLFLKTQAPIAEANLVAREILTTPPRAAVIVAAAFLDTFLERLIRRHLVELPPTEVEALFGPDRPLGSFSAKIKMARAMGLIGPKTAHDMNIMREIRNAFAHGLRRMNFETAEVKQLLHSFYCLKEINLRRVRPRRLFLFVASTLSTHLNQKGLSSPPKYRPPKLKGFSSFLD
jgi:DNA-binding MltR family transcriptional regulator